MLKNRHNHHRTDHATQRGSLISLENYRLVWTRGCSILTMKLKIRVVLDDPCDDDYDDL